MTGSHPNQWPRFREVTGSTHSRGVSTWIALSDGREVELRVGATTRDSDPWPEPHGYFPGETVAAHDAAAIAAVLAELFTTYARCFPKVSIAFRERDDTALQQAPKPREP